MGIIQNANIEVIQNNVNKAENEGRQVITCKSCKSILRARVGAFEITRVCYPKDTNLYSYICPCCGEYQFLTAEEIPNLH